MIDILLTAQTASRQKSNFIPAKLFHVIKISFEIISYTQGTRCLVKEMKKKYNRKRNLVGV